MKILFLYLDAFRQTGGIEKFNRAFMKALQDISNEGDIKFKAFSVYDNTIDERYIDKSNHTGFRGNKFFFALKTLSIASKYDLIIVGHINLSPVVWAIKRIKPKIRIFLVAHGIEVWDKQSTLKAKLINQADTILAVSNFTKKKILESNQIAENKIKIFPNTLDPFFKPPDKNEKPKYLLERYGLTQTAKIVLTITRINKDEDYKGYDLVIKALPDIIKQIPNVKYLLCGKYGLIEESRLKELANQLNVQNNFIMTGFIKEEELIDHYLLGDVFVLPSKREGFGIVLIEAAACGLPVIAGNQDGSVDALLNGKLGKLVDPENSDEIINSITELFNNPLENNRDAVLNNFAFNNFSNRLKNIVFT